MFVIGVDGCPAGWVSVGLGLIGLRAIVFVCGRPGWQMLDLRLA